jgi:hypothetical protein
MKNPWLKKNPFLSMWLSGANAVFGAARGSATAAARRQSKALMDHGARQIVDFWTGGLASKPTRRKKRR